MDAESDSSEEILFEPVPGSFIQGSTRFNPAWTQRTPCHLCEVTRQALVPSCGPKQRELYDEQDRRFVRLGCWHELLSSTDCPTCACIVAYLQSSMLLAETNPDIGHHSYWLADFYNRFLYIRLEADDGQAARYLWPRLSIRPIREVGSDIDVAARVNRRWADLDRIRD